MIECIFRVLGSICPDKALRELTGLFVGANREEDCVDGVESLDEELRGQRSTKVVYISMKQLASGNWGYTRGKAHLSRLIQFPVLGVPYLCLEPFNLMEDS